MRAGRSLEGKPFSKFSLVKLVGMVGMPHVIMRDACGAPSILTSLASEMPNYGFYYQTDIFYLSCIK
jgi:hypothetical protein